MKRTFVILALTLALGGCATPGRPGRPAPPHPRQLEAAVALIRQGETARAKVILTTIVESPPVKGITDEALFRLALLNLKPAELAPSEHLLRRLKKDFPASNWTVQAQPLLELIGGADELRRQNRSLKGSNRSLSRANETLNRSNETLGKENEELRRQIDQLKHLDLELERKSK
ncbi:hypothetical protein [Geomesophilobacter sediminis]|uniref:Tetratricopeptide repeat protein n=1 Tax=Geomesophilobacter sediminis TaxID=2798584 RepID=A0A8J7LUH5_9BACT|nr:hypothetical protein [Geomesophilobacter sediminis]MBJ6724664.1 hypothetical protein [Geomesophilobacter sediminis]